MSRGAARGPPFGMGWDVESSGAGAGLPPGFWFLLGFRVCDGPVEGEYSTCVLLWSRGSCHIWGTWLDAAKADGEFSQRLGRFANRPYRGRGVPARRGGAPSGGMDSCLRRKDGWGVAVWGGPRSTLRPASADLQQAQGERPLSGMDSRLGGGDGGEKGVGGFLGTRRIGSAWTAPARPFDGAQGERPLPGMDSRHRRIIHRRMTRLQAA